MSALPLVLASRSPRRRDLLEQAGVTFEVRPADIPEERDAGEPPRAFAMRLAEEKARHVADAMRGGPPRWVLGADTIVVLGEDVLGKPRDPEHAVAMLERLQGVTHTVITGVCLASSAAGSAAVEAVESQVTLHPASRERLVAYVATGEPLDKAGAYAIQGEGRALVATFAGSKTNVIGLPVDETLALLRAHGTGLAP